MFAALQASAAPTASSRPYSGSSRSPSSAAADASAGMPETS